MKESMFSKIFRKVSLTYYIRGKKEKYKVIHKVEDQEQVIKSCDNEKDACDVIEQRIYEDTMKLVNSMKGEQEEKQNE